MKRLGKDKRGLSFDTLPTMILTFVVVGALSLAGFVTWQALSDAYPDDDANASTANNAQMFLGNVSGLFTNIGAQLPTIGTIIGVGLLIGIVIAAFVFGRGRGMF